MTDKTDVFGFGMTGMAMYLGNHLEAILKNMTKYFDDRGMSEVDFSDLYFGLQDQPE